MENREAVNEEIVEGDEGKSESLTHQSVRDEKDDNFTDQETFDVKMKMETLEEGQLKCNIQVENSKHNTIKQNSSLHPSGKENENFNKSQKSQPDSKENENSHSDSESEHSMSSEEKMSKSHDSHDSDKVSMVHSQSSKSIIKGPASNQSLEEILEYYQYLRSRYNSDHQWEDPDFPNDINFFNVEGQLPERLKDQPIEFSRVEEIEEDTPFFSSEHTSNINFVFTVKRSHLVKDLFFLGAVMMLFRKKEEFMKNLVIDYKNVETNIKAGFCGFTFFINGEWKHVTVDTYIPCNTETEAILSNVGSSKNSIWLCLLQKAYAKIHRSYEALSDVSVKNTLVDLTGGVSKKIQILPQLTDVRKKELFDKIRTCLNQKYLIGSMKFDSKDEDVSYLYFIF
jgi:hypothetical protein